MPSITQICIRIFKDKKEKGKKRWEKYCYVPSGTRPFPPVGNLHMTNLSVRLPIFTYVRTELVQFMTSVRRSGGRNLQCLNYFSSVRFQAIFHLSFMEPLLREVFRI